MAKKPTIFILSDNCDFIEPLTAIVTRELAVSCKSVSSWSELPNGENIIVIAAEKPNDSKPYPIITANLPVRVNNLLADIEIAIENLSNPQFLDIGNGLQLSLQQKALTQSETGQSINLTDKESNLLKTIAESKENGISRELLLKEVWGIDTVLDTHTLETHIYRLRKKIRDSFGREIIKATEGGYGL